MDAQEKQEKFLRSQRSLRGPAWRTKVAQELSSPCDRSAARFWDQLTLDLAKFYTMNSADADASDQAAKKYPHLVSAILLDDDSDKTDVIKLLILADVPVDEIAKRVEVEQAVVEVWERLFFDTRGMRSSICWLSEQVFEAERKAGNSALAARMKLASLAGVEGVDAILSLDDAPVDEAEKLFQRKLALNLKFDDAMSMAIDSDKNRMKFVKLHLDLQISEKRLELAGQKLAARCAVARDHFELNKMRIESSHEHAEMKEIARRSRVERRQREREVRNVEIARMREVQRSAQLAEQKAAACRIAESPLMQLAWGKSESEPPNYPEPLPTSLHPRSEELQAATWSEAALKFEKAFDTGIDPYDIDVLAEAYGFELTTQGGA